MKKKTQTTISTFTHNGQDIEILLNKGTIGLVFDIAGKRYGANAKIQGTSKLDIMNACFSVIINYLETYDAVKRKLEN